MITLPFPTYSMDDLPRETFNDSPEMFEHLAKAVQAYALLYDPLTFLRGDNDQDDEVTQLADATSWLISNAPLVRKGEPGDPTFHTDNHPHEVWLRNVRVLARRHIKANYQQGREDLHPVFKLVYVPVSKSNGEYWPYVLQEEHWSLFIRAIQAQGSLNAANKICKSKLGVDLETCETCKAFVTGAFRRLAEEYPTLGKHDANADRFTHHSSEPEKVLELWKYNVLDAAAVYMQHYGT